MAYRSLLASGVYEIGVFDNTQQFWAITRIGEDDAPERTYSVMCSLSPMPAAVGTMQFSFSILEMDVATGQEHSIWDGRQSKHLFPLPSDRYTILIIVVESVGHLVAEASPDHVFIQACDANLPDKALRKYERILETFAKLGYGIEEQPEYHGRKSWWLERHHA